MSNQVKVVISATDKTQGAFKSLEGSVSSITNRLTSLTGLVAGFGVGLGVGKIIETVDQYALLSDRLKLVTGSATEFQEVQKALYNISQESRNSYSGTIDLYTRMARSTEQLGVSQNDLLSITEAINKALIISGASSQASEAALIQLGQGMAAGALRGEELNSVLEQAPRLAKALADGMGVDVGKLKDLGKEGLITSEKVVSALLIQADSIDKEYSRMGATVGQSVTVLNNSIGHLISGANESTSATELLAGAIIDVSKNVDHWADSNRELIDQKLPEYIGKIESGISSMWNLISNNAEVLEYGLIGLALGGRKGALIAAGMGQHIKDMTDYYNGLAQSIDNLYGAASGRLDPSTGAPTAFDRMASSHVPPTFDMGVSHVDIEKLSDIDKALRDAFALSLDLGNGGSDALSKYEKQIMAVDSALERFFDTIDEHSRNLADAEIAALDSFYALTDEQEMARIDELWSARMERMKDSTAGAAFSMSDSLLQVQTVGETVAGRLEDGLVDAFSNIATGAKSMGDIAVDILQDIANEMMRVMIIQPMISAGSNALFGLNGVFSGMTGNYGPVPSAAGNVFSGPGISAYSNTIVDRPTLFPFATGIGLMGEAGEEAILPLTRTSGGDLGVKAQGGGNVTVNVYNQGGEKKDVSDTQIKFDPRGMVVDIFLRDMAENGPMRRSMAGGF